MPPAKQAIEIFWYCLCPLSHGYTLRIPRAAWRRGPTVLKRRLNLQCQNHTQNFALLHQVPLPWFPQTPSICGRRSLHQGPSFSPLEMRTQDCMRKDDIERVYQRLHQTALEGNFPQTQACVNIILKERGEKPNIRLYGALLLASADHEFGSASEATSVFEEMVNEGIIPDSAIYHAVLRVRAT